MHIIAQIGAGRMGAVHLRNAHANPRLDLRYVVDPRPEARALAASLGAEPATLEAVLADTTVTGIVVASSTDAHLEHALRSIEAGKTVFCEKPLDLDAATLLAAQPRFLGSERRLFVAFNRRFDPEFARLREALAAGEIGELETLHIVNHDPAAPPAHFIPSSGGLFKDFTIHDFDMAAWLLPEPPVELFATASCLVDPAIAAAGDVDTARVLLRDARGRLCVISNTRRSGCGYDQRIEAFGSHGALKAGERVTTTVETWREGGAERAPLFPSFVERYAEAYRREMDHFADVLDGAALPLTGYAASVASLQWAEAAARSAATGLPVRL